MLKLYYSIWADAITKYGDDNPSFSNRIVRYHVLLYISGLESLIIPVYLIWKRIFTYSIGEIGDEHYVTIPERFAFGTSHFIMFVMPLMLLNYILVVRKKRCLYIVEKYTTARQNYGQIFYILCIATVSLSILVYNFMF